MPYRGPHNNRVAANFNKIAANHGETVTWLHYVTATSGSPSAYFAGGGTTFIYTTATITALMAAPQMGESRYREQQLPAGQVIQGDAVLSLSREPSAQDVIVWRGVNYRVEGDRTPINYASAVWYRTILKRGDATG